LKLDLHDIYNRGEEIELALHPIIDDAWPRRRRSSRSFPGRARGSSS